MIVYIYDGSFEGLLTSIYEAYYRRERPGNIVPSGQIQAGLFDEYVTISPDLQKAEKVLAAVRQKISPQALMDIYHVFLSNAENKGMLVYNYLHLGWKTGSSLHNHLSDDRVLDVYKICLKVTGEQHRMLGLIRFKRLKGGVYYSPIEPDHNIVPLVTPHFANRMSCQDFIIHDVKRSLAALYNRKKWIITNFSMDEEPLLEKDEMEFQSMWKEYYESIAVADRTNPKLQKRCMPVRYWKYLTEKIYT